MGLQAKAALLCGATMIVAAVQPAVAQQKSFNIPSEEATKAIPEFGRQAGLQIIAPADRLEGVRTQPVHGELDINAALAALLRGTGLEVATANNGLIILRFPASPNTAAAEVTNANSQQFAVPVETVVVTGSHIKATAARSPAPVTTLIGSDLEKASPGTLAGELREVPALLNTAGPQTYPGVLFAAQSFLNLRGLNPNRTLTLIDGQRMVPTSYINTVDVNMIPQALVKRVDVVTGGASAAYGSDAIAGVVNLILDDTYSGLKGRVQYGQTGQSDDIEKIFSLTGGTEFLGGRAHIVLSGEYYENKGVRGNARAWHVAQYNVIPNPSGTPDIVMAPDVRAVEAFGGVVLTGSGGTAANNALFRGIMFGPGGQPMLYNFGTLSTSGSQSGGNGMIKYYQDIDSPLVRQNFYTKASYKVSEDLQIYADVLVGSFSTDYVQGPQQHNGTDTITIQSDNAYLPSAIKTAMNADGVTSLSISRGDTEPSYGRQRHGQATYRGVVGFNAKLGTWDWTGYFEDGFDREYVRNYNNEVKANYTLAIDAVVNPNNGNIVCRSALISPTNGCQPFNIFGQGSPSDAAVNYVNGVGYQNNHVTEKAVATNFSGTLFDVPAGPVTAAFGGEYRFEKVISATDSLDAAGAFRVGNYQPYTASYDIEEGYAETEVPILKDVDLAKSLSINSAFRVTNYSNSGIVSTWKGGIVYQPIEDLRFRFTRSRDIRAPNLNELYSTGARTSASPIDPFKGNVQLIQVNGFVIGNLNLKPEVANTYTAGVVVQPIFVPSLNVSVDYYNIDVRGLIATVSLQTMLNQCFAGVNLDCGSLTRDANGNLTQFIQRPINYSSVTTSGFDVEVDFRLPMDNMFDGWGGDLGLRGLANIVQDLTLAGPGLITTQYAGYTGGIAQRTPLTGIASTPKFSGQAQVHYTRGSWDVMVQGRFIGAGGYFNSFSPLTQDFNHVDGTAYLDLNIERSFDWPLSNQTLYFNIRNALDSDPPLDPEPGSGHPTNTALFDQLGRMFRIGARFNY